MKDDDSFIFHPVDILPITTNYSINKTTKFCATSHSPDGRFYKSMGFKCTDYKKINGYSNNYWGWGLEDDDLFTRMDIHKIQFDTSILDYKILCNDGNGNTDAEHFMPLYNSNMGYLNELRVIRNCNVSGIDDVSYKIIDIVEYHGIKKYIIE